MDEGVFPALELERKIIELTAAFEYGKILPIPRPWTVICYQTDLLREFRAILPELELTVTSRGIVDSEVLIYWLRTDRRLNRHLCRIGNRVARRHGFEFRILNLGNQAFPD